MSRQDEESGLKQNVQKPICGNPNAQLPTSSKKHCQGLRAFTNITACKSWHKLVKIEPQNIDQTLASKIQIYTKRLAQNQSLTIRFGPNFILKILTKLQLPNLN